MAYGDAREGKWRGNWRMKWVANALHAAWEHGVSSITTADAHTSAASKLNWRPRLFKWTRLFRRKTKSGFCACAITFQTQSNEFCLIIFFCHCYYIPIYIATYVADTVLFGGVGVRKFAKNLQKFVKSWWQSWLLELWHRACGLLGGRDTADSRFT